ncbi:MAG TPA: hypothetical protein VGP33_00785 [Chloroflexota bacterium]|nr:hypothetical protein [Chloroflexota bacterium]
MQGDGPADRLLDGPGEGGQHAEVNAQLNHPDQHREHGNRGSVQRAAQQVQSAVEAV